MSITKKVYYEDQYLSSCEATVVEVKANKGIVLDQTIAFPEGGGQEADNGVIEIQNQTDKVSIPFFDVQKSPGRAIFLQDFPVIQVECPIIHFIDESCLNKFEIGMKVKVKIDAHRRDKLTIAHTGTHIALMGIEALYPDIYPKIYGCHIKESEARLDFNLQEKMSAEDIVKIADFANNLISEDSPVKVFQHEKEPEAWYWQCKETIYPCGGTHLPSTSSVGKVVVRRKSLGKGKQRIIFSFPEAKLQLDRYHEHKPETAP